MYKIALSVLAIAALAACNNEEKEASAKANATAAAEAVKPAAGSAATSDIPSDAQLCYAKLDDKDTVVLSFTRSGNNVNGTLLYKFNEKDKNSGTISGEIVGDTIIGVYRFMSEGIASERQVVLLKRGEEFTEGFGYVEESNGRMVYKDRSKLTFADDVVLKQTDCDKLPRK
ncbi:MAG: hypothetical protein EOO02_05215 [Chitinophagaceae bacterium]|nr:MAG: hypothetical protein EOO02_05215 [Chitinophagaceae bacterium]